MDSESSLNHFINASVLPVIICDTYDGVIVSANQKAGDLLGNPSLIGRSVLEYVEHSVAEFLVFSDAVYAHQESWTRNITLKTYGDEVAEDETIAVEIHGKTISLNDKLYIAMQFINISDFESRTKQVFIDDLHAKGLTEWNRAKAFFQEMEEKNRLILDAAGEGIYGVNPEGKTTFVNNAAIEMLGWTAEDLIGNEIHSIIHHHHLDGKHYHSKDCPIYHTFRNEKVNRIEDEVFWCKDGKPIQVEYISTPIYDEQVLAGAVIIFRDITERRENENKLRTALGEVDALKTRLEQENEYLQEEIRNVRSHYDLVGSSSAIERTRAQIELVASTQSNVLIVGEGGVGKALVASAIHKSSPRAKRPIVRIKCASIVSERFESELFGHVRGAFQGALHDRTGKLEIASGGTLFLDEISEIPISLQGRVLKVLRDGVLERVGESRQHKIDIRIIASSSSDLQECVANGALREDLYFFLNVFPIECYPLRQRTDDIPELTKHFLKITCDRLNLPLPTVTKGNVKTLCDYHWPGNVRELQNVIERGTILAQGGKLVLNLPQSNDQAHVSENSEILTEQQIADLQRSNIIECLKKTGGRVSGEDGAAAILGIKPTTLYSRIKKFEIDPKFVR